MARVTKKQKVLELLRWKGVIPSGNTTLEDVGKAHYVNLRGSLSKEEQDRMEHEEAFLIRFSSAMKKYIEAECEIRGKAFTHKQLDNLLEYFRLKVPEKEHIIREELLGLEDVFFEEAFSPYLEISPIFKKGCNGGGCGGCGGH